MVAQVITIVNQSGKVVKTSKHLVNVFNEAKSAYNEKKAELKALRQRDIETKTQDRRVDRQLEVLTIADDDWESDRGSRRGDDAGKSIRRKPVPKRSARPPVERGYSDSFYTNDQIARPSKAPQQGSPLRFTRNGSLMGEEPRMNELVRRHTDTWDQRSHHTSRPVTPTRSASFDDIDMDLAYGELPPPLPDRPRNDTTELRDKMSGLQRLLDECNCVQHSVTATLDSLQKNPDTLAAVALTLAEISSLASKMAPGALGALKGSFPAVIALLASPEFAIAIGVGVGVTVIALGGYKIIKKIKARKEGLLLESGAGVGDDSYIEGADADDGMDELREINRIEHWRRGIATAEADSLGTSVDGEFVTPVATQTLIKEGKLKETDLKSTTSKRKGKKSHGSGRSESGSSKTSKSKSKVKASKNKEHSGLRMLFKGRSLTTA